MTDSTKSNWPFPMPTPTPELVRRGVEAFGKQGEVTERAVQKLLQAFPNNTDTSEVLLKVITINRIYSTSIYAVHHVAGMIQQADIDAALRAGDPGLVERIGRLHFTASDGKAVNKSIYSFATKYCALHQPQHYPIYDGLVAEGLMYYNQRDGFAQFSYDDLRQYPKFKDIVLRFREHYGLSECSVRDIDQFLWTLGKGLLTDSADGSPSS